MKRRAFPLFLLVCGVGNAQTPSPSAPVFAIAQDKSSVKFNVKASVSIDGDFKKWDATLVCKSTDPTSCALDLKVEADSVDTGSGMKDGKLKSKDFFNVKTDPYITFKSTQVVPKGLGVVDVVGVFTIRGVSKPETLTLTGTRGNAGGEVKGQMAFDRKEYGMTSGIPFIKIADRVEVDVELTLNRVSGPPLVLKQ